MAPIPYIEYQDTRQSCVSVTKDYISHHSVVIEDDSDENKARIYIIVESGTRQESLRLRDMYT